MKPWRVITHIHSCSSSGPASPGHAAVTAFIRREFGQAADRVNWSECLTSVADLEAILEGRRTARRVDVLLLTDHMSAERHVIDEPILALARRCPRFAIGAELATCLPDGAGGFTSAPEVLLYGSAEPHRSPMGSHYGLTQAIIDDAFGTCTRHGAPSPDPHLLRAFCADRRLACALAHPLDGHALPLPRLLEVIRSFPVIETLNGGYSEGNARLLERLLVELRRQLRDKTTNGDCAAPVRLGGSDAHFDDFDRVVTLFADGTGAPDAGVFIASLLEAPGHPARSAQFVPDGRGIGRLALYWDVARIIVQNLAANRGVLGEKRRLVSVVGHGFAMARRELAKRRRWTRAIERDLTAWLEASTNAPTGACNKADVTHPRWQSGC